MLEWGSLGVGRRGGVSGARRGGETKSGFQIKTGRGRRPKAKGRLLTERPNFEKVFFSQTKGVLGGGSITIRRVLRRGARQFIKKSFSRRRSVREEWGTVGRVERWDLECSKERIHTR